MARKLNGTYSSLSSVTNDKATAGLFHAVTDRSGTRTSPSESLNFCGCDEYLPTRFPPKGVLFFATLNFKSACWTFSSKHAHAFLALQGHFNVHSHDCDSITYKGGALDDSGGTHFIGKGGCLFLRLQTLRGTLIGAFDSKNCGGCAHLWTL